MSVLRAHLLAVRNRGPSDLTELFTSTVVEAVYIQHKLQFGEKHHHYSGIFSVEDSCYLQGVQMQERTPPAAIEQSGADSDSDSPSTLTPPLDRMADLPDQSETAEATGKRWIAPEDKNLPVLNEQSRGDMRDERAGEQSAHTHDEGTGKLEEHDDEAALELGHWLRIKAKFLCLWAEDDGKGAYWSKNAFEISAVRLRHGAIDPKRVFHEESEDERDPSVDRAMITPSELPVEVIGRVDAKTWCYRLTILPNEFCFRFPMPKSTWFTEDQLEFDWEATYREGNIKPRQSALWSMIPSDMEKYYR
ncbi:hypothetical protein LTR84_005379 [Exophiala bonariae]|uniref:Uncharacterized protein n=1 Tax=Exophiala bonariae TaxID=1690606 RepID=A0AAV9N7U8_9EURO|nr:hypothetical protein LTR84_005379 [Exophiala bonariae]